MTDLPLLDPRRGRRFSAMHTREQYNNMLKVVPFEVVVTPKSRAEHSAHGDYCETELQKRWFYEWDLGERVRYRFECEKDAIQFKLRFG